MGLLCFYGSLALKFHFYVLQSTDASDAPLTLSVAVLLCGLFLGFCFRTVSGKSKLISILQGVCVAVIGMVAVSAVETVLSDQFYSEHKRPEAFSSIQGHCGVQAGRAIYKLIHSDGNSPREGAYQEYRVNDECRLIHFSYLWKHEASSLCEASESPIECQIRWMGSFAEHGYWNQKTRKFFFDQVMKLWPDTKKEEDLVKYVLKDQEFESGKQSILKQAGVDETLNDRYMLIQEREDLNNLMLTREIFTAVVPLIAENNPSPPPYLFKFRDAIADFQSKVAKIPELEKEIKTLEGAPQL